MKQSIFEATKSDSDLSKKYKNYTPEFIIEGLVKKLGKNMIIAERGTGKTRILLFIAYAIIYECKEVLGYKINSWGNVLFLNLEISEQDFKSFTDPIARHYEAKGLKRKHSLIITSFRDGGNKLNDIKLIVQQHKPLLTIIDSYKIYQALVCNEEHLREINNSNFDKVTRLIDELILELETTVVLINHTNKGTSQLKSNSDLGFGPGILFDLCDQITLIRKAKQSNQRIIVPDKSRYSGEGYITTNLIEIRSTDPSSAYPDELYFTLIESDVQEDDHLPTSHSNRIPEEKKRQIFEFVTTGKGTQEQAAEIFLGKKTLKGTVSKIMNKYQADNN